jgi:Tfp pilus assembly ATPase PilU
MPRFFIHIRSNGHCWSYDEDGLDFPNVETARKEVLRAAQDLISVFAARDQDPRDHAVEIENEAGEVVLHLPFSEIFLQLRSEPRAYRSC